MSSPEITVDIEKSDISSSLNSSVLLIFGMGIYTVIYFETMYIYLSKTSKRRIVPATITLLFLCNIIQTGVQWYGLRWQFIDNGDTRDSVFNSVFEGPRWAYLALDIPYFISFVLADGLLIWRCFIVWNRSLRVIALPLLLILTETALFVVQTVFQVIYGGAIPPGLTAKVNHLLSAGYLTTFVTSLLATVLIAYRIYSVSKLDGVSTRRFRHIIDIVVQSGAVYSLSLVLTAIIGFLPEANNPSVTWSIAFEFYTSLLVNIIGGISSTILVARVAMLASDATFPSTAVHLSGLQFNVHSTRQIESTGSVSIDRNLPGEGQAVEGKVQ